MNHAVFGPIQSDGPLWHGAVSSPKIGYEVELEGSGPLPTEREIALWRIIETNLKAILESAPPFPIERDPSKFWRSPDGFNTANAKVEELRFFDEGDLSSLMLAATYKDFVKTPCLEIAEDGTVVHSYWCA